MGATVVIRRVSAAPAFVADRSVSAFETRNERNHSQPLKERAREILCESSSLSISMKMESVNVEKFHEVFGPRAGLAIGKGTYGTLAIYVVNHLVKPERKHNQMIFG